MQRAGTIQAYRYRPLCPKKNQMLTASASSSATTIESQIPSTPMKTGSTSTTMIWKTRVRRNEITAETTPLLSAVKNAENENELKNLFRKSLILAGLAGLAMTALAELLSLPLSSIFVGYDAELLTLTCQHFAVQTSPCQPQQAVVRARKVEQREYPTDNLAHRSGSCGAYRPPPKRKDAGRR